MMKRTFFTVLLCFLLSFSIFTVDVYASSSTSKYYLVGNSMRSLFPNSSSGLTTLNPSYVFEGHYGSSYFYTLDFNFKDYLSLSAYSHRSGSFPDYTYSSIIPRGVYSFFSAFKYTFTPFGNLFLGGKSDISFTVTPDFTLPDGLNVIVQSPTTVRNDGSFELIFYLFGSCYFGDSGVSSSIPFSCNLNCHVVSALPYTFETFSCKTDFSVYGPGWDYVDFTFVSPNASTDSILGGINDTIKQEHQEEIDSANQASGEVTSGVGKLTNTLSTWEIITMPFNLVKNFAQAIAGDGSSALTFPSFSMMGYQIWPSYTFDLQTVASNFPVLYNGLHLVSGTVVVTGFVRYLWRKWSLLVGDDMPEGSDTS